MGGQSHTAGPWEVTDGGDEYGNNIRVWACAPKLDGACEPLIAEVSHVDHAPHECSTAEARANARLIAAAPDLLEALKEARAHVASSAFGGNLAQIDAVISKATGEGGQ